MIIKAINIGFIPNETQQRFEAVQCVSSLYLKQLGKFKNDECTYLKIYFTEKTDDDGRLDKVQNFYHYYKFFDYDKYMQLTDNYSKKALLSEYLNQAIIELCDITKWGKNVFNEAFLKCKELEFRNEWLFKNKYFPSPNRDYYVGLYHIHDIDNFSIFEVLLDKNKKEIARRLSFKDNVAVFRIENLYWSPDSESFNYKFKTPSKIFNRSIHELIDGKQLDLSMNTSGYFK